MKCPVASKKHGEQLLEFAVGRLRGAARRELASHIRDCAACSDFVASQAALWSSLDEWAPEPVSVEFSANLLQRVNRIPRQMFWNSLWSTPGSLIGRTAIPLALATIVLVAGAFLNSSRTPEIEKHVRASHPAKTAYASVTPAEADQLGAAFDDLQLLQQFDLPRGEAVKVSRSM